MDRYIVEPYACVVASAHSMPRFRHSLQNRDTARNVRMAMLHVSNRAWRALQRRLYVHLHSRPHRSWVACCAHEVQSFDLDQKFWCLGFDEQIFWMNKTQNVGRATKGCSALSLPTDVAEQEGLKLEEDCPKWPAKQPAPAAMQRYRCTRAYARGVTSATGTSAETRHRRMRAFWLGNMSVSASATARVYSKSSRPRRRRTYGPAGRSAKASHSSWRRASIFCL